MELTIYYEKIREIESMIAEEFAIVVSHATPGGGKAGIFTEVARRIAARLIVDGIARLATAAEAGAFREALAEAIRVAEQRELAAKLQFAVVSTDELNKLKAAKSKHRLV